MCVCVDSDAHACLHIMGVLPAGFRDLSAGEKKRARTRDEEDRICLTSIGGRRRADRRVRMDRGFQLSPSSCLVCVCVCVCVCVFACEGR